MHCINLLKCFFARGCFNRRSESERLTNKTISGSSPYLMWKHHLLSWFNFFWEKWKFFGWAYSDALPLTAKTSKLFNGITQLLTNDDFFEDNNRSGIEGVTIVRVFLRGQTLTATLVASQPSLRQPFYYHITVFAAAKNLTDGPQTLSQSRTCLVSKSMQFLKGLNRLRYTARILVSAVQKKERNNSI